MSPVTRRMACLLVAAVVVARCGPSSVATPPPATPLSASPSPPAPSPTQGAASPSSAASASAGPFEAAHVAVQLEPVMAIPGQPLSIAAPHDGSGTLYVVAKAGRVWIVRGGRRLEQPLLDVSAAVSTGSEQGLLGLALHPDYPRDPRFYIDYTNRRGDTVVSEWRLLSSDPDRADPSSERVLLTVDQPFPNHNGGAVVFGPDRKLYVSLGDGGSSGDPQGNGQRLDTLLAKILRIDVEPSGDRPYGIPGDNPFVGTSRARPEIFVTGMRNPWRISFDRTTGDLWIGDVGQNAFEEIDVVRAGSGGGQNFGWNRMEGFHCYGSGSCSDAGLIPPVSEYAHPAGCSVTGGVVYRGAAFPLLRGAYLFSDYCSGTIWAIDAAAAESRDPTVVGESHRSISAFGEDEAGEVYATDLGGQLLHVVATTR